MEARTNHHHEKKLKIRYNDSIRKHKQNLAQKHLNSNINKVEFPIQKLNSGLTDISAQINKPELQINNNISIKRYNWTNRDRISLSAPKYHILKATTPRRDYNYLKIRNFKYTNTPKALNNSSYYKTAENFSHLDSEENNNYISLIPNRSKYNRRSSFKSIISTNDLDNNNKTTGRLGIYNKGYNYTNSTTNNKELITLNNILQKQNKELRLKIRENRYKINDLLNNIKVSRMDNQRLINEKNSLLMNIDSLEKEIELNKNMYFNELESKNNTITELNEEIIKLKTALDEKLNEIMILKNNIKNHIKNPNTDINRDNTINDLLRQNNELKRENEYLKKEKENISNKNEIMNNNLLINNNNIKANNEKINYLIKENQENQKYKKAYPSLKKEIEKLKNYISHIQDQKKSFDDLQKEYQKKINDLNQHIDALSNENNELIKKMKEYENNIQLKNENINNNDVENQMVNRNNTILAQINEIKEQNEFLKIQISQTNHDNLEIIDGLKKEIEEKTNEIEEKTKEINNYQEKIKELEGELNLHKNKDEDISKSYLEVKQEKDQLQSKISILENMNYNNQQQIEQLKNINNKLNSQINSFNSVMNSQMSQSKNQNKENEQQIIMLKQKNDELQKNLMESLNSETNYNNKINKILQEKNNLLKENVELKKEINNLKDNINELENENHKNILKLSKIGELEKQLKQARDECNLNFEELKEKGKENQNLLDLIKTKELENEQLKQKLAHYGGGEEMNLDLENNINIEVNKVGEELKREIVEQNKQIEVLKKEIENYKGINNKILKENTQLKEKMQLIQSEDNDGLIVTIENLKDEIKDKNLQIEKLIEENNIQRMNIKKNTMKKDEDEKEIDLNNKHEHNPFRTTINSAGLSDADRIKLYKEQINELKITNESDKIQIKILKEDIKNMKAKIKDLETFGGQMKDLNEFISVLNQALLNYKPKKKEQKDALNRIINVLNNH